MKKTLASAPRLPPAAARNPKLRCPQVADAYNKAADKTEESGRTADTEQERN